LEVIREGKPGAPVRANGNAPVVPGCGGGDDDQGKSSKNGRRDALEL